MASGTSGRSRGHIDSDRDQENTDDDADLSATEVSTQGPPQVRSVYSAAASSGPRAVIKDLIDGARMVPVWTAFAWDEIQQRYRRSVLGLAWIVISYLMFVAAISFFFGGFSRLESASFASNVALGYAAFFFLIGMVTDGCAVFNGSASWIKSTSLPYSIYIYKSLARSIFPFALQMICAFVFLLLIGWRPTVDALAVIPSLPIYLLFGVAAHLFFGLVSARWRDISHLVSALTRITFFLTPVLWTLEDQTGIRRTVAEANPFTHLLQIFRGPLLGQPVTMVNYLVSLVTVAVLCILAIIAASYMRRRLPFWV